MAFKSSYGGTFGGAGRTSNEIRNLNQEDSFDASRDIVGYGGNNDLHAELGNTRRSQSSYNNAGRDSNNRV